MDYINELHLFNQLEHDFSMRTGLCGVPIPMTKNVTINQWGEIIALEYIIEPFVFKRLEPFYDKVEYTTQSTTDESFVIEYGDQLLPLDVTKNPNVILTDIVRNSTIIHRMDMPRLLFETITRQTE